MTYIYVYVYICIHIYIPAMPCRTSSHMRRFRNWRCWPVMFGSWGGSGCGGPLMRMVGWPICAAPGGRRGCPRHAGDQNT